MRAIPRTISDVSATILPFPRFIRKRRCGKAISKASTRLDDKKPPLVSTRVGQATELVVDGENGWLVEVEDVDALVDRLETIASGGADLERIVAAGRAAAAANSYEAQVPLWRAFFDGFVST